MRRGKREDPARAGRAELQGRGMLGMEVLAAGTLAAAVRRERRRAVVPLGVTVTAEKAGRMRGKTVMPTRAHLAMGRGRRARTPA